MNATTTCPGSVSLQDYLLGRMSEATAADVERHLASCPECSKRLPTIQAEDDFVADFRANAGRPPTANALLDRLAADMRGLFCGLPTGHDATPPADGDATPPPAGPVAEDAEDMRLLLAPPQQPDEIGRLGDFRILKELGRGGMGVVFLAEETRLRRRVALKVMKPALAASATARKRFQREAELAASLTHDHIVAIHQIGEAKGVPFLAMPLLEGESLDARLKREGRLPPAEVLRIGRETAEGLAAAHERGLIHRDVKPANLWLETMSGGRSRVKVLDFGLARSGDGDAPLTQPGLVMGTPAYMAPEQVGGRVDHRADMFSLGCVLYCMATGRRPFEGETPLDVLRKVATDRPCPPGELNLETPPELSDLILRLLAKDPAQRPQSAREVIQAIQTIEDALCSETAARSSRSSPAVAALTAPPHGATAPSRARRPWWVGPVAMTAGLLAAAAVAAIIIRIKGQDGKETEIKVPDGSTVVVEQGGKVVGTVGSENGKVVSSPDFDKWIQQVAALSSTAKQVDAVAAKLEELNPDFDGQRTYKDEGGVVTELQFVTDNVTDISPVRALTGLQILDCGGNEPAKGRLADLSPLKDMKLWCLDCSATQVSDLSPLKGMKVTALNCNRTPVSDLRPLHGTPLVRLNCGYTKVEDLSPLKGTPLVILNFGLTNVSDLSPLKDLPLDELGCPRTLVSDLSPLKGMQVRSFNCDGTSVSDLSPLRGMRMIDLSFSDTKVSDLSPLKDMPLAGLKCNSTLVADLSPLKDMTPLWSLHCERTPVTDLSPLKGLPLMELTCDFKPERDAEILRSLKTLKQINGKPVTDFWKEVDEKGPDMKP